MLAAGWWSSPGALVFLTGIVTLPAGGVPLLLRPWMEGRLEGRRRVQEWRGEARALCVDLEEHLLRMERSTLFNMPTPVISTWEYGGCGARLGPSSGSDQKTFGRSASRFLKR